MRYRSRDFLPKGAVKVADKHSDAVAYAYTDSRGKLAAIVYFGKQGKSVSHHVFRTEAEREKHVREMFNNRRAHAASVAERRRAKNAPHKLEVGHILRTCWGYDQTNVEFFRVERLIGRNSVELVELQALRHDTIYMQGEKLPSDKPMGEKFVRRVNGTWNHVRIDRCRIGFLWSGEPAHFSEYA